MQLVPRVTRTASSSVRAVPTARHVRPDMSRPAPVGSAEELRVLRRRATATRTTASGSTALGSLSAASIRTREHVSGGSARPSGRHKPRRAPPVDSSLDGHIFRILDGERGSRRERFPRRCRSPVRRRIRQLARSVRDRRARPATRAEAGHRTGAATFGRAPSTQPRGHHPDALGGHRETRIDLVTTTEGPDSLVVGGEILLRACVVGGPAVRAYVEVRAWSRCPLGCDALESRLVRLVPGKKSESKTARQLDDIVAELRDRGHAASLTHLTPLQPVIKPCSSVAASAIETFSEYPVSSGDSDRRQGRRHRHRHRGPIHGTAGSPAVPRTPTTRELSGTSRTRPARRRPARRSPRLFGRPRHVRQR